LQRGLKSPAVRLRHQNLLAAHRATAHVNYPGLPHHPNHRRASELFGGMLSFEFKGGLDETFISRSACLLRHQFGWSRKPHSPSCGDIALGHGFGGPQACRTDGLIRLSVGLEAAEDLIEDFESALAR
jgi:cystathionine gamma-synthase